MPAARALKYLAVLCPALLGLCAVATWPFLEMAQCDDFAYVRSAKVFAETGHFEYFGWASAMLGWQIALGGLFFKLFGFSFTAARGAVLVVALFTAYLMQRCFVRMGLTEGNAAFATLTLVLSPLFLSLSLSFMSDISGMFAIVVCLYMCLRAIEARTASHTTAWLIAAALSNALLGTARQTGWLGVLVLVPSACWIVRRRRLPFAAIGIVWLLCLGFVYAALRWFSHQMYATVEGSSRMGADSEHIYTTVLDTLHVPLEIAFFLVPILVAFCFPFFRKRSRLQYVSIAAVALFAAYGMLHPHSYWLGKVLAPASAGPGSYVTAYGILELPAMGSRPLELGPAVRLGMSIVSYFSAFACVVLVFSARHRYKSRAIETPAPLFSWSQVLVLLGPMTLTYCGFLVLRLLADSLFDRYLLPLFMVLAYLATRFYQERISAHLPRTSYAVLLAFAAYGVGATHDWFSMDRARLAAADQLRRAGLARADFYAGFGYDGWTQIDGEGYVDVNDIRTATGIHQISDAWGKYKPCGYWHASFFPVIRPAYALSYDTVSCGVAQDRFAPVAYHLWLPPFSGAIYTQRVSPESLGEPSR